LKDTKGIFEKRSAIYLEKVAELKTRSKQLSATRIFTFIFGTILIVQFANTGQSSLFLVSSLIFVVAFIWLLKRHNGVRNELNFQMALLEVNKEEIDRKDLNLKELESGNEFYDAQHPYHEDLDVFGKHSLFQFINRSATNDGKNRLANWLSQPADQDTILSRQHAVKELIDKIDFRQNFQAYGKVSEDEKGSKEKFLQWLKNEDKLPKALFFRAVLLIFPAFTIIAFAAYALDYLPIGWGFLVVVFNMAILGVAFNPLNDIGSQTQNGYLSVGVLKDLIELVEKESFENEGLVKLQGSMSHKSQSAAKTLTQLKFLLDTIHNRANMMYIIFDLLLILDVYWLVRIYRWKEQNKLELQQWFDVMAEFDALNSLAGYAFANPESTFPKMNNDDFNISATQLGHPLIHASKRVNNDFNFQGRGGICLITGSNMSGKSTFLRTLGINMILAQAGAPVIATDMAFSRTNVFTSMRTTDELEENVSSFYAELQRLKKLLESISTDRPTLFMIDEVLKGTNSEDRHKGAIALIKQLNKAHAFGLVSTHDLVLGNLANQLNGVKNYSFNSVIKGDEIIFDYTLTEGICKSFNATKLMQNMGIEID